MRPTACLVKRATNFGAKWLLNNEANLPWLAATLKNGPFTSNSQPSRFFVKIPNQRSKQPSLNINTHNVYQGLESEGDTIYALSTAPGRAGIAIIRISGPACQSIYNALCPGKEMLQARRATLRSLYYPALPPCADTILDRSALLLRFDGPDSVTGQNMLELHVHGGNATVKAVLSAIPRCDSAGLIRYAEAGEFTRRAFENNRLDLSQVEALSLALTAETEGQRIAAMHGASNTLGRKYEFWRKQLLEARGELEAIIDFSEDQDFDASDFSLLDNIKSVIEPMVASIEHHEYSGRRAELLRNGIRISLLGPPNVGKSSLLNRIVGREASIVSTEAGTTRDIVEVSVDIEGYLCTFADTAGLRSEAVPASDRRSQSSLKSVPTESIGPIEEEGIRRAKQKAIDSDFIIAFVSVEKELRGDETERCYIQSDHEALQMASRAHKSIIVVNKTDLVSPEKLSELLLQFRKSLNDASLTMYGDHNIIPISCNPFRPDISAKLGEDPGNIRNLIRSLVCQFKDMTDIEVKFRPHLGVTERQSQLLKACRVHCLDYLQEMQKIGEVSEIFDVVFAAEHLRAAANCLSRITGRGDGGDVEEVLGVVFEK